MVESLRDSVKRFVLYKTLQSISTYSLFTLTSRSGGPKWTRFAAAKPGWLQQSTGLLLRAAFRVHFGSLGFTLFSPWGFHPVL